MKISDISIQQLLPPFMQADECNLALSKAANEALQVFAREIAKLSTFDALDQLNNAELDALADELNVLWYDRSYTDIQKRAILLNSDKVYMRLGTKSAVMQVVQDIFGASAVEEFHEYGGKPHYFRIRVERAGTLSAENEAKLLRTLELVKRKSQWLDSIFSETVSNMPLNVGMQISFQRTATPRIDTWQDNSGAEIYSGAAIQSKHSSN